MIVVLFLSCATPESVQFDTQSDFCSAVQYHNFGASFMVQNCLGCHHPESTNRQGAPEDVALERLENIIEYKERIQIRIEDQSMPPQGGLKEEDRNMAIQWLDCLEDS